MRVSLVCVLVAAIGVTGVRHQASETDVSVSELHEEADKHTFYVAPTSADPTATPPVLNLTQVSSTIYIKSDEMEFDDASGELSSKAGVEFGHYNLLTTTDYNYTVLSPCGNGVRDVDEQCDDGNQKDGDGCGKNCKVEGGWGCAARSIFESKQKCFQCTKDECNMFYNGAWSCLSTTPRKQVNSTAEVASLYKRDTSGFCTCSINSCMLGSDCIATRVDENHDGYTRDENGKCECGGVSCKMPMAKGFNVSPLNHMCIKMTSNYALNATDGTCVCSPAVAGVSSTDPTEARMPKNASCKVFPITAIEKVAHGDDRFGLFECMTTPYFTSKPGGNCESCDAGSCRLPRNVGDQPGGPGAFGCYDKKTMTTAGFVRNNAGGCECESASCLAPDGDGYKCVELAGSFPYGFVKTASGKCGCADASTTCLMPTKRNAQGAVTDWKCLELGGVNSTYGSKFMRGADGNCQCKSKFCKDSPGPASVGEFDCLDITKQSTYGKGAGGWCECRSECRFSALTAGNKSSCAECPKKAGSCVARCTQESSNRTSCQKYCVTKHMKFVNPATSSVYDMVEHKDKIARVIQCFVKKDVACDKTNGPMLCIQTITARVEYNCPGRWSEHANRNLPDGSETHGFKSICSQDDLECQLQKCDRSSFSQICLDKMLLT